LWGGRIPLALAARSDRKGRGRRQRDEAGGHPGKVFAARICAQTTAQGHQRFGADVSSGVHATAFKRQVAKCDRRFTGDWFSRMRGTGDAAFEALDF